MKNLQNAELFNRVVNKAYRFAASPLFFYGILLVFIIEAAWIAVSGAYPLFYDEAYHLSFIKIYSEQLSPFISSQEVSTAVLGDITRTPSYLYHYLMSFPYRWSAPFVTEFYYHLLVMRFINIGFVVIGLILFKKLFDEIRVASIYRNIALFFVVLVPIFPFVAAHINYDNLLFLLTPLVFLTTKRFIDEPSMYKLTAIFITLSIASLVKHTFLVVAASIAVYLAVWFYRRKRSVDLVSKRPDKTGTLSRYTRLLLITSALLVGLLAAERLGGNIVKYQTPAPSCKKVQSEEFCRLSHTVLRHERLKKESANINEESASTYAGLWLGSIMDSLLSEFDNGRGTKFTQKMPLPILNFFAWLSVALGVLLFVRHYPRIKNKFSLYGFIIFIPLIYSLATFLFNYSGYRNLHVPIAVQGRYFLIFLPVFVLLCLYAFRYAQSIPVSLKTGYLLIVMIVFLQGGIVSYIIRSESTWYENKQKVINLNEDARKLLTPLVVE